MGSLPLLPINSRVSNTSTSIATGSDVQRTRVVSLSYTVYQVSIYVFTLYSLKGLWGDYRRFPQPAHVNHNQYNIKYVYRFSLYKYA